MKTSDLPELLVPAGSPEALDAAISGGADAVYFGGTSFNARQNAKNFDTAAMTEAIDKCHFFGVRTNITFNTLLYEKEYADALRYAEFLYTAGADALIVADTGLAREIAARFPEMELHASTQASIHSSDGLKSAEEIGFRRVVLARELSRADLESVCSTASELGIETEMFIHGALCVSVSGQCLFSSLVGQRSGNRGECAQPCRLPYGSVCGSEYPLSVKDLCLAPHIPSILRLGVSSLKIEGRMRSPEYVYTVTSIYRRLLSERRAAEQKELDILKAAFSRNGFTDAYFTQNVSQKMRGIRTDADKSRSTELEKSVSVPDRRIPAHIKARFVKDLPVEISMSANGVCAEAVGDIPSPALSAPCTREDLKAALSKLGNTPFEAEQIDIDFEDGLFLQRSKLNALRREAADALCAALAKKQRLRREAPAESKKAPAAESPSCFDIQNVAVFERASEIPDKKSLAFFDHVYISAYGFAEARKNGRDLAGVDGIAMPATVFDSEKPYFEKLLSEARSLGIEHAVCENIGQIPLLLGLGFILHGGLRLNVCSAQSANALCTLGVRDVCVSPELHLPAVRDLRPSCAKSAVVYGRLPLMVLQKCIWRCFDKECPESRDAACPFRKKGYLELCDRKNVRFPVVRDFSHRNVILNSVPVYMADRAEEISAAGIDTRLFLFSTESKEEIVRIVESYKSRAGANFPIRRI